MIVTPSGAAFLDESHAASYAKSRGAKLRKRKEKVENQAFKQRKREFQRNDYSKQFQLTKKVAQRLARLLDRGEPCISCGRPDDGSVVFCGGHFKTGGGHPELALDLRNIAGQCNHHCNQQLSGNISGDKHSHGFREGLRRRYGQVHVDYLEAYRPPQHSTCNELIAMRKEFNAEIRRLEKGLPPSKDWRSIQSQEARLAGRGEQERNVA